MSNTAMSMQDTAGSVRHSTADFTLPEQPMKIVWGLAIAVALAIHIAGFATFWSNAKVDDDDAELGAPGIEVGLELTAPHREEMNLPPGPDSEASAASSASAEQVTKTEQTELPKEKPVEAEDPDRVVSPEASKIQKDETPKPQESKAEAAAESVASEATAAPSPEKAVEAEKSVAPVQGTGESTLRIQATWQKELSAHLNRFKRFPAKATPRATPVLLTFTLDRHGHVVSTSVQQSSGDPALDQAAITMMTRADPLPAPPPRVADEGLTFTVPVLFRDRKR